MSDISETRMHMVPLDEISGYKVRPGFFSFSGATAIPGGVNFTVFSIHAVSCELLLFHRMGNEPYAALRFPDSYRVGNVYSMIVFGLNIEDFEYAYHFDGPYDPKKGLLFDKTKYLLDPYAKAVTGQSIWGKKTASEKGYKGRVVRDDFDWETFQAPVIQMEDLVIYELHVRGFTMADGSISTVPGTFSAIVEKIPYLKKLGINAVELMPVFEFDETMEGREYEGRPLLNYWGYNSISFFAPNTSYSANVEYNREGNEFKQLIKALHMNGIEVILDVVFNHTAEGNECGPCFSFKGIDNNIYYMLDSEGKYLNYSGCGNTLNCNHPIVRQMIIECLQHWVIAYRVDGFRFDLATILGRNEDGSPMSNPPLLENLAFDPILRNTKLIAEAWDAGGLYQVGSFPSWNRFAEWNGKYRDDVRSFLKGDDDMSYAVSRRISGSRDLYDPKIHHWDPSVNFITCHDGFTLYDLYAYNEKHNEKNGWDNTDGTNDNRSWNCGVEGHTDDPAIIALRKRMVRNAFAVLLASRGIPMILSGDEFCNTQFGNNNPYCQDNIVSWIDWSRLESNLDIFEFVKHMIHFRKMHNVIRRDTPPCSFGFPNISYHGIHPYKPDYMWYSHVIGVMFAGKDMQTGQDDAVYVAVNSYWAPEEMQLPELCEGWAWQVAANTALDTGIPQELQFAERNRILTEPRSVQILTAVAK